MRLEARGMEMDIVEERVAYAGIVQDAGKLRFPNALGKPRALWALAKMVLDVVGETGDLFLLVLRGDAHENGFVEAAADHFDLSALNQFAQFYKIFRAIFFQPLQERAGIVERGVDVGVFFEQVDEGLVGFLVASGEDAVEIAARLVRVDE